uniref:Uncharacterized protein n=1 Tax=Pyrodinium bahamense TaxID=73915 RepID=A0A7S0FMR2_9DINO|mmetsp:Transcript_37552/g.104429  ORF Transcript_37552/g.104429 Transcript_37552/m.104429 type:complete len:500 (+) Transcript_37552:87-1586(+)
MLNLRSGSSAGAVLGPRPSVSGAAHVPCPPTFPPSPRTRSLTPGTCAGRVRSPCVEPSPATPRPASLAIRKCSSEPQEVSVVSAATTCAQGEDVACARSAPSSASSLLASVDQAKELSHDVTAFPQLPPAVCASVEDMPRAWRGLLEDLMRRSQWATEETRRELLEQVKAEVGTLQRSHDSLKEELLDKVFGAAEAASEALRQSDEALEAARLSAELVQEAEDASLRKMGKVEASLRMELNMLGGEISRGTRGSQIEEARAMLEGNLRDTLARTLSMEGKLGSLERRLNELTEMMSEFEPFRENVGRRFEELQSQAMALQVDTTQDIQRTTGELAAARRDFEARCSRLDASVQALLSRVQWSAGEAPKNDAGLRDIVASEARTAIAERCEELNGLIERLRSAALQEARAALAEKCCELRELNERICNAALEQARRAVAEKCGELRSFAERLRDALLEEVRGGLAVGGLAKTPRELPRCGASGSAIGAARALRSSSPART